MRRSYPCLAAAVAILGAGGAVAAELASPPPPASTAKEAYTTAETIAARLANPPAVGAASIDAASHPGIRLTVLRRDRSGEAEAHGLANEHLYLLEGRIDYEVGGTLNGARMTAANEWRSGEIAGARRYSLKPGDVMYIPAGVPHRIRLAQGVSEVRYVGVKINSPPPDAATGADLYLTGLMAAEKSGATFLPITEVSPGFPMADAYAVQRRYVAQRQAAGDRVVGYKGSLMSQKSLDDRGVKAPLFGTLFASGAVASGGTVSLCRQRRPIIEMKLGYTFAQPIRQAVTSLDALKAAVATVRPVVELPDIAYRDDKTYGAVDMVAANVTAANFVQGAAKAAGGLDLNALQASIARDGKELTKGKGDESLGEQWGSLRTVVNQLIAQGLTVEPGQIVLTGKIGDKPAVAPGAYAARFGPLGEVKFVVKPCN